MIGSKMLIQLLSSLIKKTEECNATHIAMDNIKMASKENTTHMFLHCLAE